MTIQTSRFKKLFERFILLQFLILLAGIPLVFTSLTRSVFEVNKLLLLRLIIIVVYGAWIFKTVLYKSNNIEPKASESYSLFGFRWRRIGLEIAITAWVLANLISIVVSENIFIGLIGAYDRWEGLATILNYILLFYMVAKLVNNFKYRVIMIATIVFATSISSFYGVIQSLGIDFMQWSKSPTDRVFACINNPVHFCAYVAMVLPLGLSFTHYLLKAKENLILSTSSFFKQLRVIIPGSALIISLALTFHTINLALVQFLHLFGLGYYALYHYQNMIPSRQTLLKLSLFFLIFISMTIFDGLLLNRFQITALIATLFSFFIANAAPNKTLIFYRFSLITTLIIFYSMFLSFSRATIVGFSISIAMFFYFMFNHHRSYSRPFIHIISTFSAIFLLNICFIFKLHLIHPIAFFIEICLLIAIFILLHSPQFTQVLSFKTIVFHGASFILLVLPFFEFNWFTHAHIPFTLITTLFLIRFHRHLNSYFLSKLILSLLFINICFFMTTLSDVIYYYALLYFLYIFFIKSNDLNKLSNIESYHFMFILISFGLFVCIPLFPLLLSGVQGGFYELLSPAIAIQYISFLCLITVILYRSFPKKFRHTTLAMCMILALSCTASYLQPSPDMQPSLSKEKLLVANNIKKRMKNLASNAKSNARIYMWLSVPPWIMDYPLFGSGPDTIRYLYPKYRHPEYGIHEGGHNFTPDRLHNEYLNTLVTKGIVGFTIKYIFFFGGWYYIMLRLLEKYKSTQKFTLIVAILCAPTIYSIQVLFNFGVVATLFLFYFLLGMGLSFVNDEYENKEISALE